MTAVTRMSRGDYLRALGVVSIWGLNFVVVRSGCRA